MTSRSLDLEKTVLRLANLAQLLSRGANTRAEGREFYRLLHELFELPQEQEAEVTNWAMSTLLEFGDSAAAKFLLDELELDAQLQDLVDDQGQTWSCLLFALPVAVPSGDQLERMALSHEGVDALREVLSESEVISQSATVALVPRLFTFAELAQYPYSGLARLTRHLGLQALQGAGVAQMPQGASLSEMDAGSCSPYVDLYFVVGVVAAFPSELEDVFPPLGEEAQDVASGRLEVSFDQNDYPEFRQGLDEDSSEGPGQEPGESLGLEPWERVFCEVFDDTFFSIQGSLAVAPPDGLLEDLRRGQELAREVGLLRMLDVHCATRPRVVLGALQDEERTAGAYVEVRCLAEDSCEVLEAVRWPVFVHETDDEALEQLSLCLADAQALVVDEQGAPLTMGLSVLLH